MGTIHLKAYQFKSASNPKSQGKWYPRIDHYSTITTRELCQLAADDSHVERSEVEYVLNAIVKQIEELALNGHTIEIPELGHISIAADTRTVENFDEVSTNLVERLRLNLRVSKEIRESLTHVTLRMG